MSTPEVLIYDPDQGFADDLARRFAQIGWSVHTASDEAEAGYRLLLWNIPSELPTLAILRLPQAGELLEFCTILREEQVLELLPVVGLFDQLDATTEEAFRTAGVIPIQISGNPWPAIRNTLSELGLYTPPLQRVDQEGLKPHQEKARAQRRTKEGGTTPSRRKRRGTPSDEK